MAGTILRRLLDEFRDEGLAVACGISDGSDEALLGVAVGKEIEIESIDVAAKAGVDLKLMIGGQATQAVHLVAHLRCGYIGGFAQAGIEGAHPLRNVSQLRMEGISRCCQLAFAFDGHGTSAEALRQLIGPGAEQVLN